MVELLINNIKATIKDGKWRCNESDLLFILENYTEAYSDMYAPNHDYTKAQNIVKYMGGKITHHDEVEFDPDVVY